MWYSLGRFILRFRFLLLIILLVISGFMAWHASRVKLSYDFSRAIPTNNPKYIIYQDFKKKFGEDGNLLVIGIQTPEFFTEKIFNEYGQLQRDLKNLNGVDDIVAVSTAINLVKDTVSSQLKAVHIFPETILTQEKIDSG